MGEVAELKAEVDELKVRVARDEELEKLKKDISTLKDEVIAQRPPQVNIRGSIIGVASPLDTQEC